MPEEKKRLSKNQRSWNAALKSFWENHLKARHLSSQPCNFAIDGVCVHYPTSPAGPKITERKPSTEKSRKKTLKNKNQRKRIAVAKKTAKLAAKREQKLKKNQNGGNLAQKSSVSKSNKKIEKSCNTNYENILEAALEYEEALKTKFNKCCKFENDSPVCIHYLYYLDFSRMDSFKRKDYRHSRLTPSQMDFVNSLASEVSGMSISNQSKWQQVAPNDIFYSEYDEIESFRKELKDSKEYHQEFEDVLEKMVSLEASSSQAPQKRHSDETSNDVQKRPRKS